MSLAVTVLKNSAVLLLFLLFISCGTKNKEYANNVFPYSQFPQEKELKYCCPLKLFEPKN